MTRGSLVTVVVPGAYGKPRPALVVQSDLFADHPSLTILPLTTELRETPLFRLAVDPTPANGLTERSQVMVDKVQTVPREKATQVIGRLDPETLVAVNRSLALWLGFGG